MEPLEKELIHVNSGKVYYVSFTIPRRNPGFDPSLYPPVECGEAALTYDKWVGGETAEPVKKDINTIENKFVSQVQVFEKKETKVEKKTPEEKIKELEGKIVELTCKINLFTEENAKLKKQIEAKKAKKGGEETKTEEPKPEEPKPEEPKPDEVKVEETKTEEPKPEEPKPEEPKPEEPKPDEPKPDEVKVEEVKVEEEKPEEPKEEAKPEA